MKVWNVRRSGKDKKNGRIEAPECYYQKARGVWF